MKLSKLVPVTLTAGTLGVVMLAGCASLFPSLAGAEERTMARIDEIRLESEQEVNSLRDELAALRESYAAGEVTSETFAEELDRLETELNEALLNDLEGMRDVLAALPGELRDAFEKDRADLGGRAKVGLMEAILAFLSTGSAGAAALAFARGSKAETRAVELSELTRLRVHNERDMARAARGEPTVGRVDEPRA